MIVYGGRHVTFVGNSGGKQVSAPLSHLISKDAIRENIGPFHVGGQSETGEEGITGEVSDPSLSSRDDRRKSQLATQKGAWMELR